MLLDPYVKSNGKCSKSTILQRKIDQIDEIMWKCPQDIPALWNDFHPFFSFLIHPYPLWPFPLFVSTLMQWCQVPPEAATGPAPAAEAECPAEEAQCGFESLFWVSSWNSRYINAHDCTCMIYLHSSTCLSFLLEKQICKDISRHQDTWQVTKAGHVF